MQARRSNWFVRAIASLLIVCFMALVFRPTLLQADDRMRTTPAPTVTSTLIAAPSASAVQSPFIVGLKQGEVAPFTGVLLNPPAVAKIAVDAENAKKECDLTVKSEVGKQKAMDDTRLADKDSDLKFTTASLNATIKAREDEIKTLRSQSSSGGNNVWWFTGGGAAGIGLTLAIVYVVGLVRK